MHDAPIFVSSKQKTLTQTNKTKDKKHIYATGPLYHPTTSSNPAHPQIRSNDKNRSICFYSIMPGIGS